MFWGKARRRRENFEDLALKIVDFVKEIDEKRPLKPQNFLGAFGADSYTYLVRWALKLGTLLIRNIELINFSRKPKLQNIN